ncbi:MAG: hypothetical protein AAGU11_06530 [Syntrophobacteraceae bacterium]
MCCQTRGKFYNPYRDVFPEWCRNQPHSPWRRGLELSRASAPPYQPQHDGDNEYQAKSAAKPGPAIDAIGIITTASTKQ